MESGKNRGVKVDLSHTIYDDLGIPENNDEIVERIKYIKRVLQTGKELDTDGVVFDKNGINEAQRIKLLNQVERALALYENNKDINELLNKYAWTDLAIFRNLFKEKLMVKYTRPDIDRETRDRLVSKELNAAISERMATWGIITTPESRREYDEELFILRKIQAIEDEKIRARVLRNKIAKEDLRKRYGYESFDRSELGGDKVPPYKHGSPTYGWNIREYSGGKQLIFTTETSYEGHPELGEKVEIFAHGAFEWGTMYRQNAHDASFSPTYLDGLCEVISIKKTDKQGNEVEAYGIAQTRDLGYFTELTEDQIKQKESRGIQVMLLSTPEESREQEYLRNREERIMRRRASRNISRPKTLEDRLKGFMKSIGLEGVEEEPRKNRDSLYIPPATDAIKEFIPRVLKDPNKKYKVFVLSPVRYKIPEEDKPIIAKTRFADYMLAQAKEKNGYCFGSIADLRGGAEQRVLDETIKACQFATRNPGLLVSGVYGAQNMTVNSLESALSYLRQKDKARTARREAVNKNRRDVIEFLGE